MLISSLTSRCYSIQTVHSAPKACPLLYDSKTIGPALLNQFRWNTWHMHLCQEGTPKIKNQLRWHPPFKKHQTCNKNDMLQILWCRPCNERNTQINYAGENWDLCLHVLPLPTLALELLKFVTLKLAGRRPAIKWPHCTAIVNRIKICVLLCIGACHFAGDAKIYRFKLIGRRHAMKQTHCSAMA